MINGNNWISLLPCSKVYIKLLIIFGKRQYNEWHNSLPHCKFHIALISLQGIVIQQSVSTLGIPDPSNIGQVLQVSVNIIG